MIRAALALSLALLFGAVPILGTWRAQGLVDHEKHLVEVTFMDGGELHVSSDGGASGSWAYERGPLGDTVVCAMVPRYGNKPVCGTWVGVNDTTAVWGGATWYKVPGTGARP